MDKTDRGAAFDEAVATLNDAAAGLGGTVVEVFVHDTLDEAVAQLQKSGMTRSAAMSAARAHPQLVEKYNREGEDRVSKAAEASKPRAVNKAAVLAFEDRVDEIAKRHGLPRSRAMSKARERFPDEFRAYQEAKSKNSPAVHSPPGGGRGRSPDRCGRDAGQISCIPSRSDQPTGVRNNSRQRGREAFSLAVRAETMQAADPHRLSPAH